LRLNPDPALLGGNSGEKAAPHRSPLQRMGEILVGSGRPATLETPQISGAPNPHKTGMVKAPRALSACRKRKDDHRARATLWHASGVTGGWQRPAFSHHIPARIVFKPRFPNGIASSVVFTTDTARSLAGAFSAITLLTMAEGPGPRTERIIRRVTRRRRPSSSP